MTVRVVTLPGAVDALLAAPAVAELVSAAAAGIAGDAAEIVPRHTGHAAESYKSTAAEVTTRGVEAAAYSDDPAADFIEFGTINNPPYRPLTRAVERAGLRHRNYPPGYEGGYE